MRIRPLPILVLTLLGIAGCEQREEMPRPGARRQAIEQMYAEYRADAFADVPDIGADELRRRLAGGSVVLVDCRADRERAVSMILGATSRAEFEADAARYRGRPVVAYCTIGYRSGVYGRRLRDEAVEVTNFRGGVLEWAHAGGVFIDPQGDETRTVHVYGSRWDLLPDGYTSVY